MRILRRTLLLLIIVICSFVILSSSQRAEVNDIDNNNNKDHDDDLTSISSRTTSSPSANDDDDNAYINEDEKRRWKVFLSWLTDNGTPLPSVTLSHFPGTGRGLACSKDMKYEDPALVIPFDVIMNSERVSQNTNLGNDIYQLDIEGNHDHLILSLYLLYEKHKQASYWKPYIDILPSEYPHIPFYYSDDDLSYADGLILGEMEYRQNELNNLIHAAQRLGSSFPSKYGRLASDEAGLKWAMVTVTSRNWGLSPDLPGASLVPLADMLNHHPKLGRALKMQEENYTITINAGYDCNRGQELFDKYYTPRKQRSDATYLLMYGFLMMDDENEACAIRAHFPWSQVALYENIKDILRKKKCERSDEVFTTKMKELPSLYFSCLQILALEEHWDPNITFENYLPYVETSDPLIPYDFARIYFHSDLNEYRTTIEEDQKILTSSSLSYNARNLVRLRLGEKQVIQHALHLVEKIIQKNKHHEQQPLFGKV
eukprot:TRINITY_DN3528_c0_g3_i1.p1 TRINITY_DN3528_c0_g3~~TRINITY_DN3528_c0_g3_i1.p1  ORF type:complete len:486 (+),score=67.93 TRINITY_DN3528_c0_g3_i1:47-1504(+)